MWHVCMCAHVSIGCVHANLLLLPIPLSDYQPAGCTDGSARLSERSTPGSGKLQICLNSTWSEFCSIGPGQSGANVVCRQLGFVGGYSWYSSTANSHPQAYLVLNCSGTEGNLLQCVRGVANSSSCYTGSVYVQCSGEEV